MVEPPSSQLAIPLLQSKLQSLYSTSCTTGSPNSAHAAALVISEPPQTLSGISPADASQDVAFVQHDFLHKIGITQHGAELSALLKGPSPNPKTCAARLICLDKQSDPLDADLLLPPLLAYNLGLLYHLHPFLHPGQAAPLAEIVQIQIHTTTITTSTRSSSSSQGKVAQQVVICKVAQPSTQPISFHGASKQEASSKQLPAQGADDGTTGPTNNPAAAAAAAAIAAGEGPDADDDQNTNGISGGANLEDVMEALHKHFLLNRR
jgi:hypothetical protein